MLFCQSENKKQRRSIYNKKISDFSDKETYSVVCKTLCEIVRDFCVKKYKMNVETISCDNDEFGHVDILLTTRAGNKYIINCLSDLERLQLNMKTIRFASEKYFDERYKYLKKEEYSFITEETDRQIDRNIGYLQNDIYTDDIIETLKKDFQSIKRLLLQEAVLREELLGADFKGNIENLTTAHKLLILK